MSDGEQKKWNTIMQLNNVMNGQFHEIWSSTQIVKNF